MIDWFHVAGYGVLAYGIGCTVSLLAFSGSLALERYWLDAVALFLVAGLVGVATIVISLGFGVL